MDPDPGLDPNHQSLDPDPELELPSSQNELISGSGSGSGSRAGFVTPLVSLSTLSSKFHSQIVGRIFGQYTTNFRLAESESYQFGISDVTRLTRNAFSGAADAVPQLLLVEGCAKLFIRGCVISLSQTETEEGRKAKKLAPTAPRAK